MSNALTIRKPQEPPGFGLTRRGNSAPRKKVSTALEVARRSRALEQQLDSLRRDRDEQRHTMFQAAQVQRKLCGPRQARRESFEIATEIFPVRDLSGDFVSVFDHGDDLVFAIGDIAGKGLAAAMWFTHFIGSLRLHMDAQGDPAETLRAVNRDLCGTQLNPPLTTLFLARLNVCSGEITYCNAGHPPTLLLREDGLVDMLHQGGPLLGALPSAAFSNGSNSIHSGDMLLGYSDGILERLSCAGHEFGNEGLLAAARQASRSSASAALFSVLAAAEDFSGDQPREDDMALVVVQRK